MSIPTPTLTPPGSPSGRPRGTEPDGDDERPTSSSRPVTGPDDSTDAPWTRPALVVLLVATAGLYLWSLDESGWANSFYSAAVQAGSESWKAFLFGSSDAASSITVDKPPLSLWVMALSARLFGLSSWSILVPQALMGVATVGLLYGTVRRTTGSAAAGLLAGLVLALTPVATLMFRFNNPDALLVLLLVGSVAATVRALESTRLHAAGRRAHPVRWLVLAGALVGLAFLTKMLQAVLVLPALALVYLLAARTPVGRRIAHLLVALVATVVSAGWWVALVELWPASSRPYIGGSQTNSILELTLGYNGLGRITGNETGSVGGAAGPAGGSRWGQAGWWRLFGADIGGQIAWLLPAATILLVAGLWFTRRAPRTDPLRAGLVVWGLWLLVTAFCFSLMAGIFHPYYTVALAPAVAALVGIGGVTLWRRRDGYPAALVLATTLAVTVALAFVLLHRSPDYLPWLRWAVLVPGLATAALLAGARHL
ncbi:MAG: glycosyltransferase family 39 protein, partial [Nocardioidaceae bacterium]